MTKKREDLFTYQLNAACPYAMEEELDWMRDMGKKLSFPQVVVMLGAGPGVFAVALLEGHTTPPTMVVVDNVTCEWTIKHLEKASVHMEYVVPVVHDSSSYAENFEPHSVDFLIIDADHSYEGCKKDIRAWFSRVRPGCFIFFHDFLEREGGFNGTEPWHPGGVSAAVADCMEGFLWMEPVAQPGISWVGRKPLV